MNKRAGWVRLVAVVWVISLAVFGYRYYRGVG